MKVSLAQSNANQNTGRGTGFYTKNLTDELLKIPGLEINNGKPDMIHYLYFDPFFLTLPPIRSAKTIVTVFDLTPIILSDLYPRGIRGEIKWQIQKRLLQNVDAIITISQSSKNDIVSQIGISPEKVFVTYLAPDGPCRPLKIKKENFVLYIGDVNANKNISTLLKAIAIIPDTNLILAGRAFLDNDLPEVMAIREEIKKLGIGPRVKFPGFVTGKEKVELLNQAKVYVQPSLYEGFGLPILEAMACGTPVICGGNSSMKEVAGNAATYADVADPNDLAEKIKSIQVSGKEVVQASKFSWKKTASQTYDVYQSLL